MDDCFCFLLRVLRRRYDLKPVSMLISTAVGLAIRAVYCPFSPGISIGLLTLMACIMSVRLEMHRS
jgi:hypothetical protein